MAKEQSKTSSSSVFGNLLTIAIILGIGGLFYYQGPEQVYTSWKKIYTKYAPLFGLEVPPNVNPEQTNTSDDSNPVSEGGIASISSDQEGKVAIQKQVKTERFIYTWKDSQGKIHYTDAPPSDPQANILRKSKKTVYKKPFKPLIETIEYKLPPDTQRKVELATLKIYQLYDQKLAIKSVEALELKIKIFGSMEDFEAYRKVKAPRLENATGFYSGTDKEAALWRHDTPEKLLQVLTHEASHAIMDFKIGYAPAWIHEGFAEYFDTMKVFGQTIQIPLDNTWHRKVLTAIEDERLPDLTNFLVEMSNEAFYSENGTDNLYYALAWSLIYYWMESERGQHLLHDLLYKWKNTRFGNATKQTLELYYPNGISSLEQDWRRWIKRPRPSHQF